MHFSLKMIKYTSYNTENPISYINLKMIPQLKA